MHPNFKRQIKPQILSLRMPAFHFWYCSLLFLFICLLAVSLFAPKLSAQNKPAPVAAKVPGNRFLFIVDTSASMERHARDVQKLMLDLLSSNATGQMHRGDTLGVWTFNADVYTGNIPLQRWVPEDWWPIASRTVEFLQQQHYEKKSRLDKALADMSEVINNSDIITVILISNGEGKMQGSPFDAEINAAYKQSLKEMKKDRMPVITVLQAKGGRIIKYTVNALPWPVVVPELPVAVTKVQPPPTEQPPVAVAQNPPATNQPSAIAIAATTPPPVTQPPPPTVPRQNTAPAAATPAPVVNVPPQPTPALTASPVVPPPAVNPGSQPTLPPAVTPSTVPLPTRQFRPPPPNPMVTVRPAPPAAAATPATVASIPPAAPPASVAPTPAPPATAITPTTPMPRRIEIAQAAPAPHASTPQGTNSHAAQATVVLPTNATPRPKFFLIAGVTLVLIALGLIVLLVRRARTPSGPSLISTTMDNRKK